MGEKELFLAVIQQAINDSLLNPSAIKSPHKREKAWRMKEKAVAWLKVTSEKVGSFDWYCKLVGLSPSWTRRKIKERLDDGRFK